MDVTAVEDISRFFANHGAYGIVFYFPFYQNPGSDKKALEALTTVLQQQRHQKPPPFLVVLSYDVMLSSYSWPRYDPWQILSTSVNQMPFRYLVLHALGLYGPGVTISATTITKVVSMRRTRMGSQPPLTYVQDFGILAALMPFHLPKNISRLTLALDTSVTSER